MKSNYDFSNAVQNPYAKKLKKTICIKLDEDVIEYFKELAEKFTEFLATSRDLGTLRMLLF